jgi:hypothetical protein
MLEVFGGSAKYQQSEPSSLSVGPSVIKPFAYRLKAFEIMMLIKKLMAAVQFAGLQQPHL